MSRYINADEIEKYPIRFDNYDKKNGSLDFVSGVESVIEFVKNIPMADIRENIKGKWQTVAIGGITNGIRCTVCKQTTVVPADRTRKLNFCPECGADMREVKE